MITLQKRRKRNRGIIFMLLPAFMFVFLMGWCIFCAGDCKTNKNNQPKIGQNSVTFLPIVCEEKQEITNQ